VFSTTYFKNFFRLSDPCRTRLCKTFSNCCSLSSLDTSMIHPLLISLAVHHPFAFDNRQHPVAAWYADVLQRSVAPLHFELVYLRGGAQSEMQAEIVLRRVTSSAYNVGSLANLSGCYVSDCPDRIARTLLSRISN